MRFVQFKTRSGSQHLGAQLLIDGDIIDISGVDSSIPNTLLQLLNGEDGLIQKVDRIVEESKTVIPLNDVTLLAPITKPDKVVCVGMNYSEHCKELNISLPKEPFIFSKFSSVIIGPYDNIKITPVAQNVDWEIELAVVIGKQAKKIEPHQTEDYIFGYTIAQDISARDWFKSRNGGQILLGKSMDTFCPLGPSVVTRDSLGDPNNLILKTWVNGKLKQNGNTSEMIFKTDFLISYLSKIVTLYPGDIILTGTPAGVGEHQIPPEFLQVGDVVESEIEGIGKMRNRKVDWEVELVVVIGKQAKRIDPENAQQYIFGYTIAQDISARDWQKVKNGGQYLLGKSMDTFCPLGPAVVTRESIGNPDNLSIKSWVNGALKQDGNTSELIFKVDFLVSYLSKIVTLYPGDIILTGTPAGVGMHRNPPEFLQEGDVVESEIEGIGRMRNTVVTEK